jgi:hypothetical protein
MSNPAFFVRNSEPNTPPSGVDYCIDYEKGDDRRSGISPNQAWKHSPFDANKTPATVVDAHAPAPGETYVYKGGVRYPNPQVVTTNGTVGNPIRLLGTSSWGAGRALADIGEVCTVRVPDNQADAGGIANWDDPNIRIIENAWIGSNKIMAFADDVGGLIFPGRWPALDDPRYPDAVTAPNGTVPFDDDLLNWLDPLDPDRKLLDPARSTDGVVISADIATRVAGQENWARVCIHVTGNQVQRSIVTAVSGSNVTLALSQGGNAGPYTNDPQAYVDNDRKSVTAPGFYAPIAAGKAVVYLRPGTTEIRRLRSFACFDIRNRSDVEVVGFTQTGSIQEDLTRADGTTRGRIADNLFRDMYMERGARVAHIEATAEGSSSRAVAVSIGNSTGTVVEDNTILRLIQVGGCSHAGTTNAIIRRNVFTVFGGSCLTANGAKTNLLLEDNIVSFGRGIHANMTSNYGTTNNPVNGWTMRRCFMFGGVRPHVLQTGTFGASNTLCENINFEDVVAFHQIPAGWSDNGQDVGIAMNDSKYFADVTITGGVFLGEDGGLSIGPQTLRFTMTGATHNGLTIGSGVPPDPDNQWSWVQSGNLVLANGDRTAYYATCTLTPFYCFVPGQGSIVYELDLSANPQDDLPGA